MEQILQQDIKKITDYIKDNDLPSMNLHVNNMQVLANLYKVYGNSNLLDVFNNIKFNIINMGIDKQSQENIDI